MKTDCNYPKGIEGYGKQALLMLAYSGVFLPLGAVLSGFILSLMLRRISAQAPKESSDEEAADSLRGYEDKPSLGWLMWHCEWIVLDLQVDPLPYRISQGHSFSSRAPSFQSYKCSYMFGLWSQTPSESHLPSLQRSPLCLWYHSYYPAVSLALNFLMTFHFWFPKPTYPYLSQTSRRLL